mgnify:FL=1
MSTLTSSGPAVVSSSFTANQKKDLLLALNKSRSELQTELDYLEESCQGFAEPDQDLKKRIADLSRRISNLDAMETRLNDDSFVNECNYSWCNGPIGFERLMLFPEIRTCSDHTQQFH